MNLEPYFSGMCQRCGLPEAVLLLRNAQGRLQIAAQLGTGQSFKPGEFLEWAEELASQKPGSSRTDGFVPFNADQVPGAAWNSPALAAAPVAIEGRVEGLLVLGGSAPHLHPVIGVFRRWLEKEIEARRLQDRLQRLERVAALGELVYHVAHEINNPLTTVVGYAELLAERIRGPSQQPLHWLKSEAERALEITRNVLSLARGQEEKLSTDVNGILRRALALREYALQVAGITVETGLESGLPNVELNPSKMHQALLNIVINAEQVLEEVNGPRLLRLTTSRVSDNSPGESVRVEIYNNGPAIPETWLERIFEPFFTSKPAGVGTGLGLALARSAVEAAGGEIAACNEDGGVVFRLRLPASRLPAARACGPAVFVQGPSLEGRRLLVVEDEPPIAQLLQDVLEAEGCRVNTCRTAEEALELLERLRFDALLSDLKLPGKGGRWLFEQISRKHRRLAHKTLFITGDTVTESTVSFLRASGQPALAKPFHLWELKDALKHLLQ